MTDDKKKYERIVTDIFDTFMQDLGNKLDQGIEGLENLKEPKKDGDLVDEKEDEEDENEDFEGEVEHSNPYIDALETLDKIIDDVTDQMKSEDDKV